MAANATKGFFRDTAGDGVHAAAIKAQGKDGTGIHGKGHPLVLRVYTANQGPQWLMVGGIKGGWEAGDSGFQLFYEGIIVWEGTETFGWWRIKIQGQGVEPLRHYVAQGVMETLQAGENDNRENPAKIESITIEPMKLVVMEQD